MIKENCSNCKFNGNCDHLEDCCYSPKLIIKSYWEPIEEESEEA